MNGTPLAAVEAGDTEARVGAGCVATIRVNRPFVLAAFRSVTLTVNVYVPPELAGGVPLRSPVGLSVSHVGWPAPDQVYPAPAPPDALKL